MAVVKLRFEVPRDSPLAWLCKELPGTLFGINTTQDLTGSRIQTQVDVYGPPRADVAELLQRSPGVIAATSLGTREAQSRWQVVTGRPSYLRLARRLEVLLRYPRMVRDGMYTVEVVARVFQLRELIDDLHRISPEVEVLRFGPDPMRTFPPTLSTRQQMLLHQTLSAGYFDVPRRTTLTQLARMLNRSKSALSESLARIERELVEASVVPRL